MIYIDDQIDQLDLHAALDSVSPQRRILALRYRQEHDQRLSLAAYQLLQQALRVEYGIDEPPVFEFTPHGKPLLVGHPNIYFNLSHCHEAAACVVSSVPVGIDVESLSSYDKDVVKAVMNDEEQQIIATSQDKRLAFIRLWTMKESLLKMTGEGMVSDMRMILEQRAAYRFHTTIYPQFVCTVCYYVDNNEITAP